MNGTFCSELIMISWKPEKAKEDVHPGLGGDLNLGPSEWQLMCQPLDNSTSLGKVYILNT